MNRSERRRIDRQALKDSRVVLISPEAAGLPIVTGEREVDPLADMAQSAPRAAFVAYLRSTLSISAIATDDALLQTFASEWGYWYNSWRTALVWWKAFVDSEIEKEQKGRE